MAGKDQAEQVSEKLSRTPDNGSSTENSADDALEEFSSSDEPTEDGRQARKEQSTTEPLVNGRSYSSKSRASATSTGMPQSAMSLRAKSQALLPHRRSLPIYRQTDHIRQLLDGEKDVLVLSGATGSGKSTQVPQMLLDARWCTRRVAVTQPRRVAAVSLARRVAEEMGTTVGNASPAAAVGYAVRFDIAVAPAARIKFLTEGMLLLEMLRDTNLDEYSAVIVDEVHERSVNVDLILALLRLLLAKQGQSRRGKGRLKVIIMSATVETEQLVHFFNHAFAASLHADGLPDSSVSDNESETSWSGLSSSTLEYVDTYKSSPTSDRAEGLASPDAQEKSIVYRDKAITKWDEKSSAHQQSLVSLCHVEGRQFPVDVMYLSEPVQSWIEAALKTIFQIHLGQPLPGDILVFLTGQENIESLEQLILQYAEGLDRHTPKILVLPLFAALSQAAQQRIFYPAPPRTRKIILATNIAETSVTVPGVHYVIDSGKAKFKEYSNQLGLEALLSKQISKSAAIQRKGRAGREAPGICYRLFTEASYLNFADATTPEILRCDLAAAILAIKARGINDMFSLPLLDRPPVEAIKKALLHLYQIGALSETGRINGIGEQIAKLPLSPALGRCLVEASLSDSDCLSELIDIVACLNVENIFPFFSSEEKQEDADTARRNLLRRDGDHFTFLATLRSFASEKTDRRAWADKHAVSHRALKRALDVRKQLQQLMHLPSPDLALDQAQAVLPEAKVKAICQCLLRGFLNHTAILIPDGSYRTVNGRQMVAIHPSSILFGKKVEAIVFTEWVFTTKSYARGVSAIQLKWIEEAMSFSRLSRIE